MATKSKNRIPVRRYPSDDLEVRNAGQTYKPHEGEWVEMRGGPSWGFLADGAILNEYMTSTEKTPEQSRNFIAAMNRISAFLVSRLVRWNWTDVNGSPLPDPSPEVLAGLEQEEIMWLISCLNGEATPSEQETETKNA